MLTLNNSVVCRQDIKSPVIGHDRPKFWTLDGSLLSVGTWPLGPTLELLSVNIKEILEFNNVSQGLFFYPQNVPIKLGKAIVM